VKNNVSASLPRKGMWISLFNIIDIRRSGKIDTFFNVINSLDSLSTSKKDYELVSRLRSTQICSLFVQLASSPFKKWSGASLVFSGFWAGWQNEGVGVKIACATKRWYPTHPKSKIQIRKNYK